MVSRQHTARRFSEVVTEHGEGPGWDAGAATLRCVDLLAGDLVHLGADGAAGRTHVSSVLAAWRPRRAGGLVVAVERGFALVDPDGSVRELPPLWDDASVRMNDGGCDPAGRFYCGSMGYDARPGAGSLWRLDPDLTAHEVLSGVSISNGLCWSPDGSHAYYVDTPTRRVDRLTFDADGAVLGREPFVVVPAEHGDPDGLTVDADGGVWVALWQGGRVVRYAESGELTDVVDVGVGQVTACAFGGDELDQLFVTTSRLGVAVGDEPDAGAVFVVDPGVVGLPLLAFAG